MNKNKKILIGVALVVIIFFIVYRFNIKKTLAPAEQPQQETAQTNNQASNNTANNNQPSTQPAAPVIVFVGPRGNVPKDAPSDYGFWSFSIPVSGVLSRSGQPTIKDFQWLKDNGWKSDIDLRIDGDHNEVSDDADIPGFNALGFNYLKIQMVDGAAPTDDQAKQFLDFVIKPENQPAHVHCRGGIGRAGIMVALYRYSVQGWPVDKAIEESKPYQGGIDEGQQKFLAKWASTHPAGSYTFSN